MSAVEKLEAYKRKQMMKSIKMTEQREAAATSTCGLQTRGKLATRGALAMKRRQELENEKSVTNKSQNSSNTRQRSQTKNQLEQPNGGVPVRRKSTRLQVKTKDPTKRKSLSPAQTVGIAKSKAIKRTSVSPIHSIQEPKKEPLTRSSVPPIRNQKKESDENGKKNKTSTVKNKLKRKFTAPLNSSGVMKQNNKKCSSEPTPTNEIIEIVPSTNIEKKVFCQENLTESVAHKSTSIVQTKIMKQQKRGSSNNDKQCQPLRKREKTSPTKTEAFKANEKPTLAITFNSNVDAYNLFEDFEGFDEPDIVLKKEDPFHVNSKEAKCLTGDAFENSDHDLETESSVTQDPCPLTQQSSSVIQTQKASKSAITTDPSRQSKTSFTSEEIVEISTDVEEFVDVDAYKIQDINEEPLWITDVQNVDDIQDIQDINEEALGVELSVFENSLKSNCVLALIKDDIEFYGIVNLTLLCGGIDIYGYEPKKMETVTICSPKGFNWVAISPMANKNPQKDWDLDLNKLVDNFSQSQLDKILNNYDSTKNAIVLLEKNINAENLVSNFANYMAENVFPKISKLPSKRPLHSTEYLLQCLIQNSDKSNTIQIPPIWRCFVVDAQERLVIAGGKSVGKSTLLRYLVNRHVARFDRVLVIDLDIGQPELFVSQTVSCCVIDVPILGPGFFFNKKPDKAFVVGHINVVMCAEQYGQAVRKLLEYCHKNSSYASMPWLINTMGYNKGFAMELMSMIVQYVRPSDIVQISCSKDINNFDEDLSYKTLSEITRIVYYTNEFKVKTLPMYSLHQISTAVPQYTGNETNIKPWRMSAKEVRYANVLARLSLTVDKSGQKMSDLQPVSVPLNSMEVLHLTSKAYKPNEVIGGIEVNIVFLCKRISSEDYSPPECLGIGVVRGVDYTANKLYISPTVLLTSFSKVNCLVIGSEFTLPQGYFKDLRAGAAESLPFVYLTDDLKSSKSIQQLYFRPPEYLGVEAAQKTAKAQI